MRICFVYTKNIMAIQVMYEKTINPQSLKFLINKSICNETLDIQNKDQAKRSPLATKILGFPWAKGVFLGKNFITITKESWLEWDIVCEPLADLIKDHLEQGAEVLIPKSTKNNSNSKSLKKDSVQVQKIKEVLEKDIQAAVAMDGGHIEFVSYKNKIVYLKLQGACAGCPSSSVTLKQGIEARLKQVLPEIIEVQEI